MTIYLANWVDCTPGSPSLITCLGAYSSHIAAQVACSTYKAAQARLGAIGPHQWPEICPVELDKPPAPQVGYGTI